MIIGIDKIIEDKKEFQKIIMSMSDINEEKYAKYVAAEISSQYRKLSLKYHPDRFGQKNFDNVPYVKQIWFLLNSSKELTMDYVSHFTSYLKKIREYRSSKINFWDEEEDKKKLGPIQERIQRIRDEDNKEYEEKERIRKEEEEKERIRKEKSLKRKEEEEKERIRKEKSLKREEEEEKERIRKEKSLKRKKEEEEDKIRKEKIRREDSIKLKIQRRKQFAEDDKKLKKEREEEYMQKVKKVKKEREEEEDRQKILKRKIDDVEPDMIPEKILYNEGIKEMDVDEQHSRSKQNGTRKTDKNTNNKTKRQQNNRRKRINDFMRNKTVGRRELIEKLRNRTVKLINIPEKMDIVFQNILPKVKSKTQKKISAKDRIINFKS